MASDVPAEVLSADAALALLEKPKKDFLVEDSIYNFAVYSLIHPGVIRSWPRTGEYPTQVRLTQSERESLFQGAIALVFIQVTMVSLVILDFAKSLKVLPPDRFIIVIPRFIASFYMHANLQAEIKNGMETMKYVVNHPYHFRRFDPAHDELDDGDKAKDDDHTEEELNEGLYIRVFYAFMLGFIQTAIALVLEVLSIVYLNSKDSFRLILMSYATLASLASFDDLYSKSLGEHPIREVVGKRFRVSFRRCMIRYGPALAAALVSKGKAEEEARAQAAVSGATQEARDVRPDDAARGSLVENDDASVPMYRADTTNMNDAPASGGGGAGTGQMEGGAEQSAAFPFPRDKCFFRLLRVVQKTLRVFYASFFFYFAPFSMLAYQYYLAQTAHNK